MTIFRSLNEAFNFLAEAVYRIFSPHDDAYPATGMQPFLGRPYTKRARARY